MIRKEDLEEMREMIKSAKEVEARRVDNQKIAQINEAANKLQKKKENEARLRATGVIELFEAARDEGIVKFDDKQRLFGGSYNPAIIEINDDGYGAVVTIKFNNIEHKRRGEEGEEYDYVGARIQGTVNGEVLNIWGKKDHSIDGSISMVQAFGEALSDPAHYHNVSISEKFVFKH